MIPIADSPRDPHHRPWGTLALILANVLVGAVTLPLVFVEWAPIEPDAHRNGLQWALNTFGFRPSEPSLLTSATSVFVHRDVLHLAGNLLYLWIYGPNVERRLGRLGFVLLYLTAALLGTMLYALVALGSTIPVVGASGAISGLLGAYLVFFPLNTIRVLFYFATIRLPAWLVLFSFIAVDNLLPFLYDGRSTTAHAAHLGGFFGGMVLAVGLRFLQPGGDRSADRSRPRTDPLARALRLQREGMVLDAHRALTELAASAKPEVAAAARRNLEEIESDPHFQRASPRGH